MEILFKHNAGIKKLFGFTLSEVLITLGIIGVVAALTIPALMTANKAHRLKSQYLKSYSTLQQVLKFMEEDGTSFDPRDFDDDTNSYYKIFGNYIKGALDCGTKYGAFQSGNNRPCYIAGRWGDYDERPSYMTLNGKKTDGQLFESGQWLLPDGSLFLFYTQNKWHPSLITVDINGYNSPPNRLGYDLFTFQYVSNGSGGEFRPAGSFGTDFTDMDKYCSMTSSDTMNGVGCTVKAKDNTDYFKLVVRNVK